MRILVVDDSPASRSLIRGELRKGGYEVDLAASGSEALRSVLESQPDLITLDVDMPDLDGFQVCRELRSSRFDAKISDVPIIFITAEESLQGRVRGFEVGAVDFLSKRQAQEGILGAVNRLLKPEMRHSGLVGLVVDDSAITRSVLVQCLKDHGLNSIEAVDGSDAFRILSSYPESVDIIVTDLRMPRMDGAELCTKIRQELKLNTPIIVFTIIEDADSVVDLFRAGATDYLTKPLVPEELAVRLRIHLDVSLLNRDLSVRVKELRRLNGLNERFIAIASDNIRTPLQDLNRRIDKVIGSTSPSDTSDEMLKIRALCKHLLGLADDFLSER